MRGPRPVEAIAILVVALEAPGEEVPVRRKGRFLPRWRRVDVALLDRNVPGTFRSGTGDGVGRVQRKGKRFAPGAAGEGAVDAVRCPVLLDDGARLIEVVARMAH